MAFYWTIPVAGVVCFVFGFLFGLPALRLDGIYLALATFALAVATPQILKLSLLEHWTGGVQGIVLIKPDAPFGMPLISDQWFYFVTLVVALVLTVCAVNLVNSRTGRAMRRDPRQPDRGALDGHQHLALQDADVRRQRRSIRASPARSAPS